MCKVPIESFQSIQRTDGFWACKSKVEFMGILASYLACIIFTAVADALEWIIKARGVRML